VISAIAADPMLLAPLLLTVSLSVTAVSAMLILE
jgi:hypothetical protein